MLQLSAGLDSGKCIEAYRRMRDIVTELRDDGPTEAEVERAQAFAAGARAIAFENTGAVARFAAQQTIVYGEDPDTDAAIDLLDQVTYDEVREIAAGVADRALGRVRRPAHRRGAGDGLRRRLAAAAALIIVVVVVVLALRARSTITARGLGAPGPGGRRAARHARHRPPRRRAPPSRQRRRP